MSCLVFLPPQIFHNSSIPDFAKKYCESGIALNLEKKRRGREKYEGITQENGWVFCDSLNIVNHHTVGLFFCLRAVEHTYKQHQILKARKFCLAFCTRFCLACFPCCNFSRSGRKCLLISVTA